jgi:hypothetical protein
MPQIRDMGQTALLPLRRKACCGFFRPGSNPRSWVPEDSMLTIGRPKPLRWRGRGCVAPLIIKHGAKCRPVVSVRSGQPYFRGRNLGDEARATLERLPVPVEKYFVTVANGTHSVVTILTELSRLYVDSWLTKAKHHAPGSIMTLLPRTAPA